MAYIELKQYLTAEQELAVLKALLTGQGIIPAIKECRAQLNCGLKEAKDCVDRIIAEYKKQGVHANGDSLGDLLRAKLDHRY